MRNLRVSPAIGVGIAAALAAGLAALLLAPLFGSNPIFLAALPFACALPVLVVAKLRWSIALLLMTRVLLDPLLNRTKLEVLGQNIGIGAIVNVTVVLLTTFLVLRRPSELRQMRSLMWMWAVYLAVCAFAVLYSPIPVKALKQFFNLLSYPCVLLLPFFIVRGEASKRAWTKLLLVSSLFPLAFANIGLLWADSRGWTVIQPVYPQNLRLQGTFTHPNILAFYAVLMIAVAFSTLKSGVFKMTFGRRVVLRAYILNFLIVLLATKTRSAWVACWTLFFLYGLLRERKYLLLSLIAPPCLLVVPEVRERVMDLFSGTGTEPGEKLNSWAWRMRLWQSASEMVRQNPVFGHGLGSFERLSGDFFDMDHGGTDAHNAYLEVLFETGLLGLMTHIAVLAGLLKRLWSCARAGAHAAGGVIVTVYLMTFLIASLADNMPHYLALNWYHWFFLGLVLKTYVADPEDASAPTS